MNQGFGRLIQDNIRIQIENSKLKSYILHLNKSIEELKKRFERESLKKKESLEFLGGELREKGR